MSAKNLFRCFVAISLILALTPLAVTQFPGQVPEDWQPLLERSGDGSIIDALVENHWILYGIGIPLLGLILAAQIGMFLFWRFARPLYASITAGFVLLTPFFGISVLLPVEAALGDLSLLVEGAVIALSYSQPFSSYFEAGARKRLT